MPTVGRPIHRRIFLTVTCALVVLVAITLCYTQMQPAALRRRPASPPARVNQPPRRPAAPRPSPTITTTILSDVDTSFSSDELPILLNRPLPPVPRSDYSGRELPQGFVYSDDGATVLWSVSPVVDSEEVLRHSWVVVNRTPGPEFLEVASLCISADGKHHAYAARPVPATQPAAAPLDRFGRRPPRPVSDPLWCAVRDDVPRPLFRAIRDLTFSPDGNHLAYAATREDYAQCVVCDGRESPRLLTVGAFAFSPDSQHFTWAGTLAPAPGAATKAAWTLRLDDRELAGGTDPVAPTSLLFSPDSRHLAMRAHINNIDPASRLGNASYAIYLDGTRVGGAAYHDILANSLRFSPDSARLLYAAAPGDSPSDFFLFDNGKPITPAHAYIVPESICLAGPHLAYAACPRGPGNFGPTLSDQQMISTGYPVVFLDGRPLPGAGWNPLFSGDGDHFAYVGDASLSANNPHAPAFSRCAIIDGKPDAPVADIHHLQFSADGRHYAYLGARNPNDREDILVIDGAAHQLGDDAVFRLTVHDNATVTAIVNARGHIRRILIKSTILPRTSRPTR